MTLHGRVLRYMALIALVACALTMLVAIILVRDRVAAQRLNTLRTEAAALTALNGRHAALSPGSHVYRTASGVPKRAHPRVQAQLLSAIPAGAGSGRVTVAGRSLLYVARRTSDGRIVLFTRAALPFAEWRALAISVLIAGLGALLLAFLLSYLLARRLTRPIAALAGATARLADGDSGVTVAVDGDDELAALTRAFNKMSAQLTDARATQRRFLESVSHEFKTPLTSISGYAEAIDEQAVAPADAARVITAEAGRLERLVEDLLELARMDRDEFTVRHELLELGALAAIAVERHLPQARELGVDLQCGPAAPSWVIADEPRLLQAVANLIQNALRLTPAGGSVTLTVAAASLTVSDTGPGLTDQDLPHAFERFYLHDRYRSERPAGSGLGLAIVKELIEAMDGTVSAASSGSGAVFTITLPGAPAALDPDARSAAARLT